MYNNEVTYDKKWDTPENQKALSILENKYFDRSICAPDCPVAWAPEVLELFNTLDKELGIQRNTETHKGYHIRGNSVDWFIISPIKAIKNDFTYYLLSSDKFLKKKSPVERLSLYIKSIIHPIMYGVKSLKLLKINPLINKVLKPKISLGQVKEKYGYLTIYYSAPEAYEEWIEKQIAKTKIKLALKGAYYPLETLYKMESTIYCNNKYNKDTIHTKINDDGSIAVTRSLYRQLMQDMGVNLEPIMVKMTNEQ